jgi:hypothetical protein
MHNNAEGMIGIFLEFMMDGIREEYTQVGSFEPRVALLHREFNGQFVISNMDIPAIYLLEGRQGQRGWETLQRRMRKFASKKRHEGSETVCLFHAVESEDYDDGRIVVIVRTGPHLEHVEETHYMAEGGPLTVDDKDGLVKGRVVLRPM